MFKVLVNSRRVILLGFIAVFGYNLSAVCNDNIGLSAIQHLIGDADTNCVSIDVLEQPFYASITFVQVDTGCSESSNPTPGYLPLRIAFDSSGNEYRLFGFELDQYRELVSEHAVEVEIGNVYELGKFYLEITQVYSFYDYYFISGTNQLLRINRENAQLWSETESEFRSRAARVERAVNKAARNWNFNEICYDMATNQFTVDYYIWYSNTGVVRHFSLSISNEGVCNIIRNEVVAEKIGFYDRTQR